MNKQRLSIAERIVSVLLELNVLNMEQIDQQLRNISARCSPPVKKWFTSVARNYIINLQGPEAEKEFQLYSIKPAIRGRYRETPRPEQLQPWAQKAAAEKKEIHHFDYIQPRRRDLWKTLDVIADWFNSKPQDDPIFNNLKSVSFQQASEWATAWRAEITSNPWGSITDKPPVVKTYPNGVRWVKLVTQAHMKREGARCADNHREYPETSMGHCIGSNEQYFRNMKSGAASYYSLRDPRNLPHATLEVMKGGRINQIKGKSDTKPVARYQGYIADFIRDQGWEIVGDRGFVDMDAQLPPSAQGLQSGQGEGPEEEFPQEGVTD